MLTRSTTESRNAAIINGSRCKRIGLVSGTTAQEVNYLLPCTSK